jgi:hypothetical protein
MVITHKNGLNIKNVLQKIKKNCIARLGFGKPVPEFS